MNCRKGFSVPEFADHIVDNASVASHAVMLDHVKHARDYKRGTERIFNRLTGFKSCFYYPIDITFASFASTKHIVRKATAPGRCLSAGQKFDFSSTRVTVDARIDLVVHTNPDGRSTGRWGRRKERAETSIEYRINVQSCIRMDRFSFHSSSFYLRSN